MSDLPLERFKVFHSTDLDFVRDAVGKIFVPHRLDLLRRDARLNARMHSRRMSEMSFNIISYGADVRVEPGELRTFYVVQVPLAGKSRVRCGRQRADGTPEIATVISPTEPLAQRLSADCTWLICRIERGALESYLSAMIGEPIDRPLTFDLGMDVTRGLGLAWRTELTAVVDEMAQPGSLVTAPLASRQFEASLMAGLLLAQRHNYSEVLAGQAERRAPSRCLTLARELIESHPEWAHTTASLARAAGASERALQQSFRDHLATTPRRYLREVRLKRVRADLLAADPATTTVGAVARHWGFAHPSRFAGSYKKRFGEAPSDTLRGINQNGSNDTAGIILA